MAVESDSGEKPLPLSANESPVSVSSISKAFVMALVTASLTGVLLMLAILILGVEWPPASGVFFVFVVTGVVFSALHFFLAVPAFLLVRKWSRVTPSWCVGLGCLIGGVPAALLMITIRQLPQSNKGGDWLDIVGLYSTSAFVVIVGGMAFCGLVGGAAFWLLYRDALESNS